MKKIIPFEKEIIFKTNVSEITSISLENTLDINDLIVSGEFTISGEYKIADTSNTVSPFTFNLPIEINIDEKYDPKKAEVDIDDFYYEIINNNILKVCIDVSVDKLEEKELNMERDIIDDIKGGYNDIKETVEEKLENFKEKAEEEVSEVSEKIEEKVEGVKEKMKSIFSNMNSSDAYITYNIYIIRDGDTVETILDKYDTTDELLRQYNDLSDLKPGDKIVIPN